MQAVRHSGIVANFIIALLWMSGGEFHFSQLLTSNASTDFGWR